MIKIKNFDKAYKIVKKLGFENYFCLPCTTWKQTKENLDKGMTLQDEMYIFLLQENINIVTNLRGNKLPICKKCKRLFSEQEFKSGFEYCEHCEREVAK